MASGGSSGSEDEGMDGGEGDVVGEKASLVESSKEEGEVHTMRSCLKARSFILALIVTFLVIFLLLVAIIVIIAVVVSTSSKGSSGNTKPTISLDDVFDPNFRQLSYNGTWTPDGLLLQQFPQSGVTLLDPADGSNTTLISASEWEKLNEELGDIFSVSLSHDQQHLLLSTNYSKVYRYSFLADYYVYHEGEVINVTRPAMTGRIQYAVWSPTENVIAYVVDGALFLFNVTNDQLTQVTSVTDRVYNGIPDWVYEEEVLGSNFALWWAPSGQNLLFASVNDTRVRDFQFPHYGAPVNQYTFIESIAYPKPGTPNPTVILTVVPVSSPEVSMVLQPPVDIDPDHYFVFAGWADETTPTVTWMNRTQTRAVYCTYNISFLVPSCNSAYEQSSSAWIEILQEPLFSEDGSRFLVLVSRSVGDDSFTHILEVPLSGEPSFLTNGEWEVTSIIGMKGDDVLYISTQTQPAHRHIYSTKTAHCLTCSQEKWDVPKSTNPSLPERCDYFSASCDDDLRYCVLHCRGPAVPYSLLVEYVNEQFEPIDFLEVNEKLHEAISGLSLPTVDFFNISSTAEGDPSLRGRITYPPGYRSNHKYPVLVYVYGGPNSQVVDATCMLASLSRLFLVSNLSIIMVSVDGRGTGFRGDSFKHLVYRKLGTYETIDMLRTGRYLQEQSYIDGSKLAIYGASYGGYMAAMVGSSGSGVFSAAISQAPVTDWHYYDSIYTERYMGQPTSEDNKKGYEDASVLPRVHNISLVDFLLIHGTGDDNVHFQHTAQLVQALTNADILFRLQFYTDKAHALEGDATRRHLYELQAAFLRESFKLG